MLHCLHLLIVDRNLEAVFAARYGERWLMPVLCVPESARACHVVSQWCAARGLNVDSIGQWLGRVAADGVGSVDWLVVVVTPSSTAAMPELRRVPLDSLAGSPSLIEYQGWATARVLGANDRPVVAGPFGNTGWPRDVLDWIAGVVGERCSRICWYRSSSFEAVFGGALAGRVVYFKGLCGRRASEPGITLALSAIAPESVARTIAIDRRTDDRTWWLTDACRGVTLAEDLCPPTVAAVARACAALQQHTAGATELASVERLDLHDAAAWAVGVLSDRPDLGTALRRGIDVCSAIPWTWTALDLDPTNVLIDGECVRFIDLDESFIAPAALAVATLTRRLSARGDRCSDAARRAYCDAWPGADDMSRHWAQIEVVSAVLEQYLGWQSLLAKRGRGEIFGDLRFVEGRLAQRLKRILGSSPRRPRVLAGRRKLGA